MVKKGFLIEKGTLLAYVGKSDVSEIIIPNGVETISAFCKTTTKHPVKIVIPNTVGLISENAFHNFDVSEIVFEKESSLRVIGKCFVKGELEKLTIPYVADVNSDAFIELKCKELVLPEKLSENKYLKLDTIENVIYANKDGEYSNFKSAKKNEKNMVSEPTTEQEIRRQEELIKKCADIQETLYFLKARNIFTAIIFIALFTGFGYGLGWIIKNWFGWFATKGLIITTSIFGVGGIGYSLSGCFLKSAQNKLAKQVYHKKKLKEVLRATNINAGQKFWESTSKSSSGVYSSVYGSSASSKEEGTKQSEKSSTTETYDSTTGLRTGYMDNKGSGRINNVYDEHGNNIGWVSDTGGDMLDVHYNDGSKGRIDRK